MGSKNKKTQAAHERATLTSVVNMVKERDLNNFFGFTYEETERFCRAFQSLGLLWRFILHRTVPYLIFQTRQEWWVIADETGWKAQGQG